MTRPHINFHDGIHKRCFSRPSCCLLPPDFSYLHSHTIESHYQADQEISFQLWTFKTEYMFFTITDWGTISSNLSSCFMHRYFRWLFIEDVSRYAWGFLEMMLITITNTMTPQFVSEQRIWPYFVILGMCVWFKLDIIAGKTTLV